MSKETILEEKETLEREIADLCNAFVQCRNIHIKYIDVNYGSCKKGWFPNNIISVDVVTYSVLEIPYGEGCNDEVIRHILESEVEE